jgi:hypothetical protein
MGRWNEMQQKSQEIVVQRRANFVVIEVDSEGNAVSCRDNPRGLDQNEEKCSLAASWWSRMVTDYYKDPETVSPLIAELLNAKRPFVLLVNVKDLP